MARWAIEAGEVKLATDATAELASLFDVVLPETDCLAAWRAEDWQKLAGEAAKEAVGAMQELFLVLLQTAAAGDSLAHLAAEMKPLLPELQEIVRCYAAEEPLPEMLFEQYQAFLPALAQKLAPEALLRYVRLLLDMAPEKKREAADVLLAAEKWQAALLLFAAIPADSAAADAAFWREVGVVFYQLGDFASARESFSRAREMGAAEKDIAAYEAWMKEVGA